MNILEIIGIVWLLMMAWGFISAFRQAKEEIRIEHRKIIEKEVDKIVREIYIDSVEANGDQFFLVYDAKTHDYIAQGKSQEEVQLNIKARFPGVVFVINGENLQKIGG